MWKPALISLCFGFLFQNVHGQDENCFDDQGTPKVCLPPFMNPALGKPVEATNTCGQTGPTEYCPLGQRTCKVCDSTDPGNSHPANFITDSNDFYGRTWWQSDTILEGIRYPVVVNLTIDLKKAYEITYMTLRFKSPRPDSFAIYKKTAPGSDWTPYQFFSTSCQTTYGKQDVSGRWLIQTSEPNEAFCKSEYGDIFPFSNGRIPFSTLEGRPGANDFDNSPVLQEWVTASAIRISLTRMNTLGDEDFGGDRALKSYYYAISDFEIGARCKCNGHANECYLPENQVADHEVCRCQHNTGGVNCETCLPLYNDRPWARATESSANECQRCECNGKADRCYFDENLYQTTGRGGRCVDCRDNTDGPQCERCKDNFVRGANGECESATPVL